MATVAVVIPCRNEEQTIQRLLDALCAQTRPPDQIVVVDDQSTDGTPRALSSWREAHAGVPCEVVSGPGGGVAAAVNAGIAKTTADVIVRLDGHSVPSRDYIARALDALERPRAGVVGGVWAIEPGAGSATAVAIARVVSHPLGSGGARYRHAESVASDVEVTDTVPFGVFRRALWVQLGGLDERLGANEDYDFNYRARATGLDVVLDGRIRSIYRARPTLGALARQYHRYGFWKARMLMKDARAIHARQIVAAAILPWVMLTTILAVILPGAATLALVLAYPLGLAVAAVSIGMAARSLAVGAAASAAFLVVHVAWSAGFLRAVGHLGSPDTPQS